MEIIIDAYTIKIDDEDYEKIKEFDWRVETFYGPNKLKAKARIKDNWVYMHRFIMGVSNKDDIVIHLNKNYLDNQKSNLMVSTLREVRKFSSAYRSIESECIIYNPTTSDWDAYTYYPGYKVKIGSYTSKQKAISAHNWYIKETYFDEGALIKLY